MRKFIKPVLSILLVVLMLCSVSAFSVFAADDTLAVNDQVEFKVGDTFEYTYYMSGATEKVAGIQMYVTYDSEYLEVVDESLEFEKFTNAVYSTKMDGYFTFNWTNVSRRANFSEKAAIVSAKFKVKKAGAANINYIIYEMYSLGKNNSLDSLTQYTITAEYSSNGTPIKQDQPPILETDPSFVDQHQGNFVNYLDGKGPDNTDIADEEQHVAVTAAQRSTTYVNNNGGAAENNAAPAVPTDAQGNALTTDANGSYIDQQGNTIATDKAGNYVDANGNIVMTAQPQNTSFDSGIIIVIAIILILLAIAVIIILRVRANKQAGAHGKHLSDGNDGNIGTQQGNEQTEDDK